MNRKRRINVQVADSKCTVKFISKIDRLILCQKHIGILYQVSKHTSICKE